VRPAGIGVHDPVAARHLARRQGFTFWELRAALDDFEMRGHSARDALVEVVRRLPAAGVARELARAQVSLAQQTWPRRCAKLD
jgi:hypothetical protein